MLLDYRYMPLRFCFAHTHAATLKCTLHSILLAQRPVHVVVWYKPIIQAEAGVDGGMPRKVAPVERDERCALDEILW